MRREVGLTQLFNWSSVRKLIQCLNQQSYFSTRQSEMKSLWSIVCPTMKLHSFKYSHNNRLEYEVSCGNLIKLGKYHPFLFHTCLLGTYLIAGPSKVYSVVDTSQLLKSTNNVRTISMI